MKLGRLPTGIAIVILLTAVSSVFGQGSGNAPPTLALGTELLHGYRPNDLYDRSISNPPYDSLPLPSPYENMTLDEAGWDAIYEGRAFIERFESTLPPAQADDLVRAGIIEPGRDLTDDPLFLGLPGCVPGNCNDFVLIKDSDSKSGRINVSFPFHMAGGSRGELHLGESGGLIWISPVNFSVHRLTRYEGGFYIYYLTDDAVFRRMGDIPYVPAEIPAEGIHIP